MKMSSVRNKQSLKGLHDRQTDGNKGIYFGWGNWKRNGLFLFQFPGQFLLNLFLTSFITEVLNNFLLRWWFTTLTTGRFSCDYKKKSCLGWYTTKILIWFLGVSIFKRHSIDSNIQPELRVTAFRHFLANIRIIYLLQKLNNI